jgi:hypothetical protein
MNAPALRNYDPMLFAKDLASDLARFMSENPVVDDGDSARDGARLATQAKKCLADLDDARKAETRPLTERVADINAHYKTGAAPLNVAVKLLVDILADYKAREEARREAEADARAHEAAVAMQAAHEAQEAAREARENQSVGEVGVDVVEAEMEARRLADEAVRADRIAARADRDAGMVRVAAPGERALVLGREVEQFVVTDMDAALKKLGPVEDIVLAVIRAAKQYRKIHGRLPPGVSSSKERK